MTQQVLALKWRPRTLSEVIGQPHVVQALSNGLDNNRLHHAFLFTGTRGVGKTTLARIFAKSLNCEKGVSSTPCGVCSICKEVDEGRFVDLIEIDAASRTRVEDTREILDNVQYAPTRGRYKIYLIDEVHMLSNSSFNALLKTLEEPPPHVKFLLATTDPQKLPVTVLSRCLRFQLKRIQDQEIVGQLSHILMAENIPFEENALKLIAKAGDGSMRDALSLLDQAIAYGGQKVEYQRTHEMLGLIDTHYLVNVLEALATKNIDNVVAVLSQLKSNGLDYHRFLEDLIDAFHLLTMMQLSEVVKMGESIEMQQLSQLLSAEDLQLFYQIALNGRKDLQNHPNSCVGFEMTLLRMVLFSPTAPILPPDLEKKSKSSADFTLDATDVGNIAGSQVASTITSGSLKHNQVDRVPLEESDSEENITSASITRTEVRELSSTFTIEENLTQESVVEPQVDLPPVDLPWETVSSETPHSARDSSVEALDRKALEIETVDTAISNTERLPVELETQHYAADQPRKENNASLEEDSVVVSDGVFGHNAQDNWPEHQKEAALSVITEPAAPDHWVESSTTENSVLEDNLVQDNLPSMSAPAVEQKVEQNSNGEKHSLQESPLQEQIGSGADLAMETTQTISLEALNNNEAWLQLVSQLRLESVLSGIAHSLVFKQFDGRHLLLERPLSVKDFRVDETEIRLAMAISDYLGVAVTCQIEYVETLHGENLHERTERLDEEQYQKMLTDFKSDEVVEYLTQEWNAQLLEKTLKAKS